MPHSQSRQHVQPVQPVQNSLRRNYIHLHSSSYLTELRSDDCIWIASVRGTSHVPNAAAVSGSFSVQFPGFGATSHAGILAQVQSSKNTQRQRTVDSNNATLNAAVSEDTKHIPTLMQEHLHVSIQIIPFL